MQRLWKSDQMILRHFGTERTSPVWNKIGWHGDVPWDIEKNSDLLSRPTPKMLSYGIKISKIARGLSLLLLYVANQFFKINTSECLKYTLKHAILTSNNKKKFWLGRGHSPLPSPHPPLRQRRLDSRAFGTLPWPSKPQKTNFAHQQVN